MPDAQLNGIKIHYEDNGSGFPMVFTHGIGADSTMWINQIPVFSKNYRTIAWDIRGHGQSETPDSGYSIEQFTEDLHSLICRLEIDRAHIVGLSMGGWISWSYALAHPEKCSSLTLSDSAGIMSGYTPRQFEKIKEMMGAAAHVAEKYGMARFTDTVMSMLFSKNFIDQNPRTIELIKERVCQAQAKGFAESVRGLFVRLVDEYSEAYLERLKGINVPALIIAGDQDVLTPLFTQKAIHESIPGSRLEVMAGCGHVPCIERPKEWNTVVMEFLDGI
jgi:3-oxoadipate enol-lactonase